MQERVPFSRYWMILVMSVVVAIGLNNVLLVVDIAKYSEGYQKAAHVLYAPPFWKQILQNGIAIPIIEEILFRGLLFKWLRSKVSFVGAMTLSSVIFGLYHGNLVQFIYAGMVGLMLAWIYEKYGCVLAPMLSHIIMNVTVCVLMKVNGFSWMLYTPARTMVVTLICVIIGIGLFVLIQKMDVTKMLKKCCKHRRDEL